MNTELNLQNLRLKESAVYGLALAKDAIFLSLKRIVWLTGAWLISLFIPVVFLGIGLWVGSMIDKGLFHMHQGGLATLVGTLVPGSMIAFFYAGWIFITLKVARDTPVGLFDLVRPLNQIISSTVVLCISSVVVGGLSCSFILIPLGGFLYLKWQLAPYYAVDQNYGPIAALKRSWQDTNAIFVPLAIIDLLIIGVSTLLGFTFVAPFLCFMLSGVVSALVYSRWIMDDEFDLDQIETSA